MNTKPIYCAGSSPGIHFARTFLQTNGFPVVSHPDKNAGYLLLDVPSFAGNGEFRGTCSLDNLLSSVNNDIVIFGGNLNHPAFETYCTRDFLKDEEYLCQNAAITADCTLQLAMPMLTTTLRETPTLIIGWGRIGKCLARLMQSAGAPVTVAVRKSEQAAILHALGFSVIFIHEIKNHTNNFRLMVNTVPYPILGKSELSEFHSCALIDLASRRGLEGENVLWARSLPGIHAPESSGRLIAETVIRYIKEDQK